MSKKIVLVVCAMVLSLVGLISLCFVTGINLFVGMPNIFLVFPLAVFYLYVCSAPDSQLHRKRYLIGLAIVIANIFPVFSAASTEILMPWRILKLNEFLVLVTFFVIGFALIELGGWCFRKAHVGSPSPKARVAVKAITLFLVNAMNLTMLAALAGLVSKGDTTWGYLIYILAILAIGTFLLALFIWFKPTWRWWIAMLPSIVILYVMPFLIGAHLNDRGEIVPPWNKAVDRGTVEAPNLPDSHKSNNPNWVDPAARSEADYPVTPLMLAAGDGTPKEVKSQLARGIDIHAMNVYGTNALMYAALAGKSENIKVLLAAGARVNDQDDKGNTALSLARQQGHQEAVALLVAAGAKDMPLKP